MPRKSTSFPSSSVAATAHHNETTSVSEGDARAAAQSVPSEAAGLVVRQWRDTIARRAATLADAAAITAIVEAGRHSAIVVKSTTSKTIETRPRRRARVNSPTMTTPQQHEQEARREMTRRPLA